MINVSSRVEICSFCTIINRPEIGSLVHMRPELRKYASDSVVPSRTLRQLVCRGLGTFHWWKTTTAMASEADFTSTSLWDPYSLVDDVRTRAWDNMRIGGRSCIRRKCKNLFYVHHERTTVVWTCGWNESNNATIWTNSVFGRYPRHNDALTTTYRCCKLLSRIENKIVVYANSKWSISITTLHPPHQEDYLCWPR